MNDIIIKKVSLDDIDQLQQIGKKTFEETFSASNTKENMVNYLEKSFSLEKLKTELNNKSSEFYFAVLDDRVIGYLKLNTGLAQTELKNKKALEIERIYVLNEFHGKKAGQLLHDKALEVADVKNAPYIWLGVWEKNPRAISFYRKNGFEEFDKHLFKLGDDEQTDILMKKELVQWA